jgi:hypothetical protein
MVIEITILMLNMTTGIVNNRTNEETDSTDKSLLISDFVHKVDPSDV